MSTVGRAFQTKRKGFHTPLRPPTNAVETGEFVPWVDFSGARVKLAVYRETTPVLEQRTMRDEQGQEVWKFTKNGERLRRRTELVKVGEETREFILVDHGTGNVEKNYDFRADPEEAKRRENSERRKQKLEQLMDVLAEKDVDVDSLITAVADEAPKRGRKKAAQES